MMIDVLVVDDHPIVLAGLTALIGSDPQLSVVGTARSAADARELVGQIEPAVAVLDLQLPDGDGITLGLELKESWPALRVLILTMHADQATVIQSLASGLDGYLLKDADPEDVLWAVHSAAGGSLVVGRSVSRIRCRRRVLGPADRRPCGSRRARAGDPRAPGPRSTDLAGGRAPLPGSEDDPQPDLRHARQAGRVHP